MLKYLLFISLLLSYYTISAQEKVIPLEFNWIVEEAWKNQKKVKLKRATTPLELPFFDDFSNSYIFPDSKRWIDNDVFINSTFGENPPTIGVATFDCIDNQGKFYSGLAYQQSFIADKLTSQPINLSYSGDLAQTIYLSFFYQPQGFGDNPEAKDSLILEFYSPLNQKWSQVWYATGTVNQPFQQVIIQINQPEYLQNEFQFRFRNYVSLSSAYNPSMVANADHWNIDYVYLNKNRNAIDLVRHDLAFTHPMQSFLKNYESMPWNHFIKNPANKLKTNLIIKYRNNDNTIRLIDSLRFIFKDILGTNNINDTLKAGAYNVPPSQDIIYNKPYNYQFLSDSKDSAKFSVRAEMVTSGFDSVCNNKTEYIQIFKNYYAYDDGTAELGYGLSGEGTQNAMVAYKFFTYEPDALRAIKIYFNRTFKDASKKYFYLTIWNSNPANGLPDKVLYKSEGVEPIYGDVLNSFKMYLIEKEVMVNDTFFIGWTQISNDFLNIGLDMNRNAQDKLYYNTVGVWNKSQINGALMLRPVFDKLPVSPQTEVTEIDETKFIVYPNPANSYVNFIYPDEIKGIVKLIDSGGKVIKTIQCTGEGKINTGNLPQGIYFIRFENLKSVITKKIIVLH